MQVNQDVIGGFEEFTPSSFYNGFVPKYASTACLSEAMQALWTNRLPLHEPWPRVMKGDTNPPPNSKNDEYKKNTHHFDQFDNHTKPIGLQPIGKVEGDEDIERKDFWRR